jgi:hypothetical protein
LQQRVLHTDETPVQMGGTVPLPCVDWTDDDDESPNGTLNYVKTNLMETRYFQLLDQLADFGADLCHSRIDPETWHEYLQTGFDESHVPHLIRILGDDAIHESKFSGTAMAPIHAWRILAELKAVEAIPALISLLPRMDDALDDWTGEELPDVFSKIGLVSLEVIESYARDTRNGDSSRICSFRLISKIGCDHLEQSGKDATLPSHPPLRNCQKITFTTLRAT